MRRYLASNRSVGGAPMLPAPSSGGGGGQATIVQGGNTISPGPGSTYAGSYASPAAEQVAGALLATRYAQYRARNGADTSATET
jgi:hypothetical protein